MDVAIVAPCPVPYQVGGAEVLWRGLQDHINAHTPHRAELIKLPSREHAFWDLVDSYRRFADLDLTGFDVVVSSKYPAWMVSHPRHVVYLLHRLRGLYDTYHFTGLPDRYPVGTRAVDELRAYMKATAGRRASLDEFFGRLDELRGASGLPGDLFRFPGPFIREIVQHLDSIGLASPAIHRYGAISRTVRDRDGYFPVGRDVFVAHPPAGIGDARRRRGRYLFTVSRLDDAKRVGLLIEALRHVRSRVELRIAGTGPDEQRLRELARGDSRVVFCGRVSAQELTRLYAGSRAVAFVPYEEDYGLVTVEAFASGKPVITCTDSGGTTELVQDGLNGLVVAPHPAAIADAVDRLWHGGRIRRRMAREATATAQRVRWDPIVEQLVA